LLPSEAQEGAGSRCALNHQSHAGSGCGFTGKVQREITAVMPAQCAPRQAFNACDAVAMVIDFLAANERSLSRINESRQC